LTRDKSFTTEEASPVSKFAVPVTGSLNWLRTQVPTPPATSGSGPPKKNWHVPLASEHSLPGHWLSLVQTASSFVPPMQ
jgi:hypothetical protein